MKNMGRNRGNTIKRIWRDLMQVAKKDTLTKRNS